MWSDGHDIDGNRMNGAGSMGNEARDRADTVYMPKTSFYQISGGSMMPGAAHHRRWPTIVRTGIDIDGGIGLGQDVRLYLDLGGSMSMGLSARTMTARSWNTS